MFRFIWTLSVHTRNFLHRYMPSNRLLAVIRTRRGLKWGLPAMLVAAPYLLVATICSSFVADGCRIGEGAVVGANSVVTADIAPQAIAVGSPARVVAARGARQDGA